jgi:uncharacterized C2H2 Zn-finger protein
MEKFCLKWNDFQHNIIGAFRDLRKCADFSDVTLVCEDDQQIEAHQIVLSACSPFFSKLLKRNKHSHPMIFMRGLKAKELSDIVDFIYLGEANVHQEDLDAFLALAEELQLKGLAGSQDDTEEPMKSPPVSKLKEVVRKPYEPRIKKPSQIIEDCNPKYDPMLKNNSVVPVDYGQITVNADMEDLKAQFNSMIERTGDGEHRCTVCGKSNRNKKDLGRHVETHIEGVSYPCNLCGKVSRSSHALIMHVSRKHK